MNIIRKYVGQRCFTDATLSKHYRVLSALIYSIYQIAQLVDPACEKITFINRSARAKRLRDFIPKRCPIVQLSWRRGHFGFRFAWSELSITPLT
jgi:hypothetical protein